MKRNIFEIYKKIALPAKASFWFIVCNVIHKSMYFLMIPIYTRIMTTEQYGTYSVFSSWVLIICAFAGLNLAGNSYNVGMIKNENQQDEYTSAILGLWWTNTTIVLLILLLSKNLWIKSTDISLTILIAIFVDIYATAGIDLWTARQKFDYKYKALVILTFSIAFLTALISIGVVTLSEKKELAAIWCKVGVLAFHSIIVSLLLIKNGRKLFDKHFWKTAYKFNIPLIAYYLSLTILNQSDRLMINYYCGTSEAGIYSIAYSLAMIFTLFNTAINGAFVPWEFRNIRKNEFKAIARTSNFILILIGLLNLVLIAVAPEIIHVVTVKEYYDSIWVIPPVALSSYLMCVYQLFINIEFYYEKNKFVMLASIFVAIVNIILNAIFIPEFGYIAAAYTTLVSYLLFTIDHYIFMKLTCRKKGLTDKIYNLCPILSITIIMAVLAFTFMALYNTLLVRYVYFLIVSGGFALAYFFYKKKAVKYK